MEAGALIVEHHVVGARNSHNIVDPRRAQQSEQNIEMGRDLIFLNLTYEQCAALRVR